MKTVTPAEAKARREAREAGSLVDSSIGAQLAEVEERERRLAEMMQDARFARNVARMNRTFRRLVKMINER